MLVSFETFVEKANRARTTDELVTEFFGTVRQHGLDRMIFCLQTNHDHIKMKPGVGVIQNYPEDSMKHYFEKGYEATGTARPAVGNDARPIRNFRCTDRRYQEIREAFRASAE